MVETDQAAPPHNESITIRVERGREGLFYATSPEVRGLLVAGHTRDEAIRGVPQALADLAAAEASLAA